MADEKDTKAAEAKAEETKAETVAEATGSKEKADTTADTANTTDTADESKEDLAAKLTDNAKKVMEMVEQMNVLELSDLVKALEDKFGVSAAAPVAVAAGGPAAGGEAEEAEEKSEYDVVVTGAGDQKIAVIKAVRVIDQSLGLVDAKEKVESGEFVLIEGAKKEDAEEAKKQIEEAGGTVELR